MKNKTKKFLEIISSNCILHIIILTFFFWLYHNYAADLITKHGVKLGVLDPKTAPIYAHLQTKINSWLILAIFSLGIYITLFRIFFEKPKLPEYVLIPALMIFLVIIDTTVAMIDGGIKPFVEPYTRNTLEYYADVPKVHNIKYFLENYVNMFNTLSGHSQTHPPGGAIFLWIVSKLFGKGLIQAAFATVVFTSITVIPVYYLAKEYYGVNIARYAAGLFLVTPNMVMFTATGMDGPFAVFPALSIFFFYKAISNKKLSFLYSFLTGLALAFAMIMNYTATVIGLFFVIVGLIALIGKREKIKSIIITLAIAGVTFVVFYVLLYFWSKFNIIAAFRAAYKKDEKTMGTGYENFAKYFHISIANLFAFLIGVGIPITVLWLHEMGGEFKRIIFDRKVDLYILAFFITLIGISFSTLFTLEVERIWIFLVPLMVIPVAKRLYEKHKKWELYVIMLLLSVQMVLMEVFLYTHW